MNARRWRFASLEGCSNPEATHFFVHAPPTTNLKKTEASTTIGAFLASAAENTNPRQDVRWVECISTRLDHQFAIYIFSWGCFDTITRRCTYTVQYLAAWELWIFSDFPTLGVGHARIDAVNIHIPLLTPAAVPQLASRSTQQDAVHCQHCQI